MAEQIKLNQNEIKALSDFAQENKDCGVFTITTDESGIGTVTKVWKKETDVRYQVLDITDYECW